MIIRAQLTVLSDPNGLENDLAECLHAAGVNETTAKLILSEIIGRHVAQYASQYEMTDLALASVTEPEDRIEMIKWLLCRDISSSLQEQVSAEVLP